MEKMPGISLTEYMAQGPRGRGAASTLFGSFVLSLARQLFTILRNLHHVHLVHLNIRPENVFLDFGEVRQDARDGPSFVVRLAGFDKAMSNSEVRRLPSVQGTCMEEPCDLFDAPELSDRDRPGGRPLYGPALDIWSAGVLFRKLLSRPDPGASPERKEVIEPGEETEGPLWALVKQCLLQDPLERPRAVDLLRATPLALRRG
jgi:serine/threonine protein kinase